MVRARLAHPSAAAMDEAILEQRNTLRSWIFCASFAEMLCILFIFMSGFHLPSYCTLLLTLIATPNTCFTIRHLWTTHEMEKRRFGNCCCGCCDGPTPPRHTHSSDITMTEKDGGNSNNKDNHHPHQNQGRSVEPTGPAGMRPSEPHAQDVVPPDPNENIGCLGPLSAIKLVWRVRWFIFILIAACIVEILTWFFADENLDRKDRGGAICGVVVCCCYVIINLGICVKFYQLVEICQIDARIMYTEAVLENGYSPYDFDDALDFVSSGHQYDDSRAIPARATIEVAGESAATEDAETAGGPSGAGGPSAPYPSESAGDGPPVLSHFFTSDGTIAPYPNNQVRPKKASKKGGLEAVSLKIDSSRLGEAVVGAPHGFDPRTGEVELPPAAAARLQKQKQKKLGTASPNSSVAEAGNSAIGGTSGNSSFDLSLSGGTPKSAARARMQCLPSRFTNRVEPYGQNAAVGRSNHQVPSVLGYKRDESPQGGDVSTASSIPYGAGTPPPESILLSPLALVPPSAQSQQRQTHHQHQRQRRPTNSMTGGNTSTASVQGVTLATFEYTGDSDSDDETSSGDLGGSSTAVEGSLHRTSTNIAPAAVGGSSGTGAKIKFQSSSSSGEHFSLPHQVQDNDDEQH